MPDTTTRFSPLPYLAPKYWPTWIALGLLRLLTLLPFSLQLKLGRGLGRLMYRLMKKRRHIAQTNIRLCFPEMSAEQQEKMVRQTFEHNGISLFETAMAWWASKERLKKMCTVTGLEHLRKAASEGKGVILLTAHFSTLEIGAAMMALHHPIQVTYKKARNPLFEAVVKKSRERNFINAIDTYDVRRTVNTIKEGLVTWYAMDQDFDRHRSVFVPFMGVNTCTLTTPSRFTRMTGASIVPYFPYRDAQGHYHLKVLSPLENFPSGSLEDDATRINALIEEYVRQAPAQYLWVHRRFKTRPEGEASLY